MWAHQRSSSSQSCHVIHQQMSVALELLSEQTLNCRQSLPCQQNRVSKEQCDKLRWWSVRRSGFTTPDLLPDICTRSVREKKIQVLCQCICVMLGNETAGSTQRPWGSREAGDLHVPTQHPGSRQRPSSCSFRGPGSLWQCFPGSGLSGVAPFLMASGSDSRTSSALSPSTTRGSQSTGQLWRS